MEVSGGAEEGFVREWTPCSHILNLIPARIQTGIFSSELCLTCVDAVSEYIALGTNVGLVYWYDRKKGSIQRLRCEASNTPITFVKIVSTVDYMVGAGNAAGQVTVFQIPKEHPENIPDNFKPKVEPKVERYTIGDLHKSAVTAIEWSKNGMRLFSGDKDGVIIMTEIDFYMHLCKSMEIVNEGHEIVQLSYYQNILLVSSVYRSIFCERKDGRWLVTQLGKRERKSLCALGAVFQHSYASGGGGGGAGGGTCAPRVYCARPGLRLWRADTTGAVLQTLLFKEAISNPVTVAELLNPAGARPPGAGAGAGAAAGAGEPQLGTLHVFRERFLVAHDSQLLYILEPHSLQALACVDQLRRILSVSVNKDEIFILEGPRSLVRLAHAPEPAALAPEEAPHPMTKSLTTSLQYAVNTVRDLTHLDQTVPYITSVLEQPIALFTKNEHIETGTVASAEECFELPPIKHLPHDISNNVLESIINEFKDVSSDAEEIRRVKSEELQRKLKLYNSIMERKQDEELIHSSRRSRRRDTGSGGSTPRVTTPVRKVEGVFTTPCLMNASVYGNIQQQSDELLEQQIEEKEKILAKMLNLESLSITTNNNATEPDTSPKYTINDNTTYKYNDVQHKPVNDNPVNGKLVYDSPVNGKPVDKIKNGIPKQISAKAVNEKTQAKTKLDPIINDLDLVPKVMKLPNNWNLENIELRLDMKSNGYMNHHMLSPDDNLDSSWEII